MDRFRSKVLGSIRQHSPLLTLAELGLAPEEVKQGIIEVLTPYFEHKEVLQDSATGILAPEAVNVLKFSNDPVAYRAFENVLNTYKMAASTDEEACWQCCAESENDILRGILEFVLSGGGQE